MRDAIRRRGAAVVALLAASVLTATLYGRAIGLPFYSDDLLQVLWVRATSLPDFWRSVGPYGDYRPLHFTLWKLLDWAGLLTPAVAHSLNLAGHALCGALVGMLAARWSRRPLAASALGAATFVAFPFAVDAVAWAVSFSYPLAVALGLGGILLGAGGKGRYAVGLMLVALAGFAYEPAVMAGPVAFVAALLTAPRPDVRRAVPYLLASAVPLACVLHFAPAGTAYALGAGNLEANAGVGLQAAVYPLAPLVPWLRRLGGGPGWVVAAVIALVGALAGLAWAARRAGQGRLFLLGATWAILWSAGPLATQQYDWMRDPPRVLYVGAAGVVMLWAAGLAFPTAGHRAVRLALSVAVAGAALVPAAVFVHRTMGLYARAGEVLWQAIGAANAAEPVLLVNLPGRITPPTRMYPLGHEGVIPMPPPSDADLLVQVHTGKAGAAFERAAGAILPALPYGVELAGPPLTTDDIRASRRVMVTTYHADGTMALEEAGAVLPLAATSTPLARFGDRLLLLSAECRRVGEQVTLVTTWRLVGQGDGAPTVFAHLLEAGGRLITQADGDPIRGLYPLALWRQGEAVRDVRVFRDVPAGPLTVAFGVWDPSAGVRWAATDGSGARLADDAVRCSVAE